jgi:hypothetical protein
MASQVKGVVPAITAMSCILSVSVPAFAQCDPGYSNYNAANPPRYQAPPPSGYHQGRVAFVPAGMTFPVQLNTSISTEAARAGDMVQATIAQPLYLGGSVIPAGTTVIGTVTEAKAGGFLGRAGTLGIKFNRIRTPNGVEAPMSAHIVGKIGKYNDVGSDMSDTYKGETWKTKVGQGVIRGAIGAGTGAALGTAIGAIAGRGGRGAGRGAWSGTAIGGGVGLASTFARRGKNVTIASGQQMQLQLDAPMTVSLSSNPQYGAF